MRLPDPLITAIDPNQPEALAGSPAQRGDGEMQTMIRNLSVTVQALNTKLERFNAPSEHSPDEAPVTPQAASTGNAAIANTPSESQPRLPALTPPVRAAARAPVAPALPAVPDSSRPLEVFLAAVSRNQQMMLSMLERAVSMFQAHESRLAGIDRVLKTLGGRFAAICNHD